MRRWLLVVLAVVVLAGCEPANYRLTLADRGVVVSGEGVAVFGSIRCQDRIFDFHVRVVQDGVDFSYTDTYGCEFTDRWLAESGSDPGVVPDEPSEVTVTACLTGTAECQTTSGSVTFKQQGTEGGP